MTGPTPPTQHPLTGPHTRPGRSTTRRALASLATLATLLVASPALAQKPDDAAPTPDDPQPAPATDDDLLLSTGALEAKIAVMGFDALGMDAERVARLESLFRKELERLAKQPMPTRREIEAARSSSRALRRCAGGDKCLAAIGKKLGVDVVVSGNVASLGDSYVINIKVVDSARGEQIRRITSDPLRGNPDELIEAVRVAAYRLLAPEQLLGSIMVLTDLVGAAITLDGKEVGKTPLSRPIYRLNLGEHALKVEAKGYVPFQEQVEVRFQKTTRVVVRLAKKGEPAPDPLDPLATPTPIVRKRPAARPWYSSPWFYVAAGITAGAIGGYVGYKLAFDPVIDCTADAAACMQ